MSQLQRSVETFNWMADKEPFRTASRGSALHLFFLYVLHELDLFLLESFPLLLFVRPFLRRQGCRLPQHA